MTILNKQFDNILVVNDELRDEKKSSAVVAQLMLDLIEKDANVESYMHHVKRALKICSDNIPTPFMEEYPNTYSLNLGSDYFSLKTPKGIGYGIKIVSIKGELKYIVSIIFDRDKCFLEGTPYYNDLIDHGWTLKPFEKKRK